MKTCIRKSGTGHQGDIAGLQLSRSGDKAGGKKILIKKISCPVVIDGRDSESFWRKLPVYSNLMILGHSRQLAKFQTEFQICHDNDNIYIYAKAFEPRPSKLRMQCTERDSAVWREDNITIQIDSTYDQHTYFTFIVNPRGVLYDAADFQGGMVHVKDYNSSAEISTSIGSDFWTIKMSIPFVDLCVNNESKGVWGINLGRGRFADLQKAEYSSLAPLESEDFHKPTSFLQAELQRLNIEEFYWQIKDPYNSSVVLEEDSFHYSAKTHVKNETGKDKSFYIKHILIDGDRELGATEKLAFLENNHGKEFNIDLPLQGQKKVKLCLQIISREGKMLAQKTRVIKPEYAPCKINVIKPFYRNNIYATEKTNTIMAEVSVNLKQEKIKQVSLEVVLENAKGDLLAREELKRPRRTNKISFAAIDLILGEYYLTAKLRGLKWAEAEAKETIRKLPPAKGTEVRVNEELNTVMDGYSFMPFGWWGGSAEKNECGVITNVAFKGMAAIQDGKCGLETLDRYQSAGLKAILYPYPALEISPHGGEHKDYPLKPEEAREIKKQVIRLKDHPALLGYYLCDEPECHDISEEWLQSVYQIVCEADPYHPCFVTNNTINGIYSYKNSADIFMPDPYPDFVEDGNAAQPIESVMVAMQACKEAGGGRVGIWIIPSWFNYAVFDRLGSRSPNLVEVRNMFYQSVIGGAKGFLGFAPYYTGNWSGLKLGVPYISKEAAILKEAILSNDIQGIEITGPRDKFYYSLRKAKGQYYIFAVNCNTEPVDVKFKLEDLNLSRLHVFAEARDIKIEGGMFSDRFALYESRIYTTNTDIACRMSLTEAKGESESFDKNKIKPGNLAHISRGVTVKTSSTRTQAYAEAAIDGATNMGKGGVAWWAWDNTRTHWLELTFPQAEEINEVIIYTKKLNDFFLQGRGGVKGDWWTIKEVNDNEKEMIKLQFKPVKAKQLRLWITGQGASFGELKHEAVNVYEFEVYNRKNFSETDKA